MSIEPTHIDEAIKFLQRAISELRWANDAHPSRAIRQLSAASSELCRAQAEILDAMGDAMDAADA